MNEWMNNIHTFFRRWFRSSPPDFVVVLVTRSRVRWMLTWAQFKKFQESLQFEYQMLTSNVGSSNGSPNSGSRPHLYVNYVYTVKLHNNFG